MKLLENHDDDFDMVRTFLIVSMIITHAFEMFYVPDYNRRLTYFVTIGFVFLSGFTTGVLYSEIVRFHTSKSIKKLWFRTLKLFVIFLSCNLVVVLSLPSRFMLIRKMEFFEIVFSILLGDNQQLFAFDILVPIALTSFFFVFIVKLFYRTHFDIVLLVFILLLIFAFENFNFINYLGVKLLLIGLVGSVTGHLIGLLDWVTVLKRIYHSGMLWITGGFVLLFFLLILAYTQKGGQINIYYQVIPTAAILLFVYLTSNTLSLARHKVALLLNRTLSANILFAYLFHIFIINLLFSIIPKDTLYFFSTSLISIIILIVTILACYMVNIINKKSVLFHRIYSSVFKL